MNSVERTVFEEEMISNICERLKDKGINIYKKDMREVWKSTFEEVRDNLDNGNKVQINNFATINLYMGKPSRVRHPISGEIVPRGLNKRRVKFSPIGELKENLNIKSE